MMKVLFPLLLFVSPQVLASNPCGKGEPLTYICGKAEALERLEAERAATESKNVTGKTYSSVLVTSEMTKNWKDLAPEKARCVQKKDFFAICVNSKSSDKATNQSGQK